MSDTSREHTPESSDGALARYFFDKHDHSKRTRCVNSKNGAFSNVTKSPHYCRFRMKTSSG
jgi:hypothetical protein